MAKIDLFAEFKHIEHRGKKSPYIGAERSFQAAAYQYIKRLPGSPIVNHTALERKTKTVKGRNGKYFSPEGQALKAQGVQAGFPDLAVYQARVPYHGLMIELKVKGGKVSDAQYYMMSMLEKAGFACFICWSMDSLIEICDQYWSKPLWTHPDLEPLPSLFPL